MEGGDRHREGQCEGECGVWKGMEGGPEIETQRETV